MAGVEQVLIGRAAGPLPGGFLVIFVAHELLLLGAFDVHCGGEGVLGVFDFAVDVVVVRLLQLVEEQEGQVEPEGLVFHDHVLDLLPFGLQRRLQLPLAQPTVHLIAPFLRLLTG